MAGSPKRRAARELAQAQAQAARDQAHAHANVAPSSSAPSTAPGIKPLHAHAQAHAHAREGTPSAAATMGRGRVAAQWSDQSEAAQLEQLASQLAPALTVRISRSKPFWCAGWLEDIELDQGTLGELLQYLRDEHGGEVYSVQVLTAAGQVAYKARVPIAGAVKRRGRPVSRDQWESGTDARTLATSNPAPAAPQGGLDIVTAVFGQLQTMHQGFRDTLRDIHKDSQDTLKQISRQNAPPAPPAPPDLLGQLRQLADVKAGFDELRDNLGDGAPPAPAPQKEPSLAAQVLTAAFTHELGRKAGPQLRVVQQAPATTPASAPQQAAPRSSTRTITPKR